jgi:hypothetical protein
MEVDTGGVVIRSAPNGTKNKFAGVRMKCEVQMTSCWIKKAVDIATFIGRLLNVEAE